MAVEEAFGARTAWVSEIDSGACKVLAHRFPDAPNLGDITAIDWATAPRVDIITGGSPCFVAGTPVLTRRGLIPIEDVIKGDQVWTHEARWRPVTATMTPTTPRCREQIRTAVAVRRSRRFSLPAWSTRSWSRRPSAVSRFSAQAPSR